VISLDSEDEVPVEEEKKDISESLQCESQSHRSNKTVQVVEPLRESSGEFEGILVTNKKKLKAEKLKSKYIPEVYEIISD
jgi:hypothetical protein